jgi:hypothetical protein
VNVRFVDIGGQSEQSPLNSDDQQFIKSQQKE